MKLTRGLSIDARWLTTIVEGLPRPITLET
jgi:hypothetical protein